MLKKYKQVIQKEELSAFYMPIDSCETIDINKNIDLKDFNNYFEEIKSSNERTKHDCELSKFLFDAITEAEVSEIELNDLRFWQWVALNPLRHYSLWRWDIESDESNTKSNRFLGAGGVTGFSENSASRLFFPIFSLNSAPDSENLIQHFWSNTQIELSISQSVLSLNPKIFAAAVRATQNVDSRNLTDGVKDIIVDLNLSSGSTLLDIMEEDEIEKLMIHD